MRDGRLEDVSAMPNPIIPEARAAAEKIKAETKARREVLDVDALALIISEHMRERDAEWQGWRAQLLEAWRNDHRATMTALLELGPERRNP